MEEVPWLESLHRLPQVCPATALVTPASLFTVALAMYKEAIMHAYTSSRFPKGVPDIMYGYNSLHKFVPRHNAILKTHTLIRVSLAS